MLSKEEIEKAYWKGYIERSAEAQEICKQCKCRKKVRELESREQKLIEKLEKDNRIDAKKVKYYEKAYRETTSEYYKKSYKRTISMLNAKRELRKEILKKLKGEKNG